MTVSLDAALSGLKVAQQSLNTIATNISNASTVGYTRKILPQESQVIGGIGSGVLAGAVVRSVNAALIADVNNQTSVAGGYNIRQRYFDRLQDFYGPTDAGRTLSTQVGNLANAFTQLSAAPDNSNLLIQAVTAASQTASKINDFSTLLTDMRRQTESDIATAIADINRALDTIARLNTEITRSATSGQSIAEFEDQRDLAIKTVAKYLQVSTFASGQQINVITRQGQTLADTSSHHLFFSLGTMLPTSYYPGGGLSGVTVDSTSGTDITQTNLGGELGALFDLRDEVLPQYGAQLDEFAHKLAERFNNEGLKLFTDLNGNVPAVGPAVVGFAATIKVNDAIVVDPTLIRNGTTGNTDPSGSNEVIRRIAQFAFGAYQYQKSTGNVDISAGVLTTLLSLTTNNRVTGNVNLSTYSPDISTLPGATFPGDFDITLGGSTQTITVLATDTAASLVGKINTAFGATRASINGNGELALNYNGTITLADNTIGATTMTALGFSFGTTLQPEPSFKVQVGTRPPVTVSIAPADTSVQLLAKLNLVPGLTATLDGSGYLVMTPTDGGDLRVTDTVGTPLSAMGVTTANIAHAPFRQSSLGPDSTLSTGLLANSTLQDYANSIISVQSGDASVNKDHQAQEAAFLQTLETRNANDSGVNIDEEMSNLIRIQSAYSAAAKMVTATQKLFDELLNAFQ